MRRSLGDRFHRLDDGATVWAGKVSLDGFADLEYDYDVVVDVDPGAQPPVWLSQLTVRRREGGHPVGATIVGAELAGVQRAAVRYLSAPKGDLPIGHHETIMPKRAQRLLTQRPSRVDRLQEVAAVYAKALAAGAPLEESVRLALRLPSRRAASQWIFRARKEGLISPTSTTRPRQGSHSGSHSGRKPAKPSGR